MLKFIQLAQWNMEVQLELQKASLSGKTQMCVGDCLNFSLSSCAVRIA